ncbi:MAG: hypothetical protein LBT43_02345 [Prevotella sp.]|jgi:DNA polymerase V|nr:hypothetical protein [Prevotella sp.]
MLEYHRVKTAHDLTQKNRSWISRKMTVIGEHTWLELQGIVCIEKDELPAKKQQISTAYYFIRAYRFLMLVECS